MPRASGEQGAFVGKVPVDGEPLHPRLLGNSADRRAGRSNGLMQLDGRLHDPAPRLFLPLRPPFELVLTGHTIIQYTSLFAKNLDNRIPIALSCTHKQ